MPERLRPLEQLVNVRGGNLALDHTLVGMSGPACFIKRRFV